MFDGLLNQLLKQSLEDKLPVVKLHLAILFVNLKLSKNETDNVISTLYILLNDKSVFVNLWTISSPIILALEYPNKKTEITGKIKAFENSKSAAMRNRVSKAIKVLEDNEALPKGWCKRTA